MDTYSHEKLIQNNYECFVFKSVESEEIRLMVEIMLQICTSP